MKSVQFLCALLAMLLIPVLMVAQVTGSLTGTVTDETGAVVPNATVLLADNATGATVSQITNSAGNFTFTGLKSGSYKANITAKGFKVTSVPSVNVQVGTSGTLNVRLQVGQVNQIIEVSSSSAELQTADAAVGNVLSQRTLHSLPSLSRDATALLQLQPMAAPSYNQSPGTGSGDITSGSVAGARADQNTFNVDGGDATSNTEANGNYNTGQGTPRAVVPTPVESLEEFRVTTNNSNTFARSAGAQVQLVTRRGTNNWHGAIYEYNQNTIYNANNWQLNHSGKPRGVWQDNRFGARVGGPIFKDRAFFFLMYEGRRFKKANAFARIIPSDLLRQGIMQFKDASGVIRQYNFAVGAPTAMCGAAPCDPRAKGMSPLVSQIWTKYEPSTAGANPNCGSCDGLNILSFEGSVPLITSENDGIARFDYKLSNNWDFMASSRYAVTDAVGSAQVDIGGITGGQLGVPKATSAEPLQPRFYVLGLTGRLTSSMTNDFRFNFLRHFWQWARVNPSPQVAGTNAALQIYAESNNAMVPLNIDTQNARSRVWNGKDYNFTDEVSWIKGNHLIQFGGAFRRQHFFHIRNDKVTGGLADPIYYLYASSTNVRVSQDGYAPPRCSSTITTFCLNSSGDVTRWNNLYAAMMGIVDHSSQMLTRAGDLSPNPPGTPNTNDSIVNTYDLHLVDTWKITPTLTIAAGLDWGAQTPPYETKGLQTVMIDVATGKPLLYQQYFEALKTNALAGKPYAPTVGFMPVRSLKWKYPYHPDWHNFAPRLSLAWSPVFDEGSLFGKVFGHQNTAIRAGYGRYFDRINGVGIVMTPALGIGFGDLSQCNGPLKGGGCSAPGSKINPATGFRIGVDGSSVPIPPLPNLTAPVIPGIYNGTPLVAGANSVYEGIDFRIDPNRKVGVEDTWSLSIQRQLSDKAILEVGYVGRVAHHLYGTADLNQVPHMYTLGGQKFSDAYDALAKQVRAGTAASAVTPQAFFETALGPGGTVSVANDYNFELLNADVTTIWDSIGVSPMPMDQQFQTQQISGSFGNSNYHAAYLSLRQRMSRGLMFQFNYTWSHAFDDIGVGQQYIAITPTDQFNPRKDYEPSYFDRRHVVTGFFVYDIPFGPGHAFSAGNWLDKVIGGWEISSILTASTGTPMYLYNFNSCAEGGAGYYANCGTMVPVSGKSYSVSAHYQSDGTVLAFSDPAAVKNDFREPYFSDKRYGGAVIRDFNRWNVDASLSKNTKIGERFVVGLALQAVNVFNHMEFSGATQNRSSSSFGKLSSQYNSPRYLSIGIRLDF